MPNTRILLAWTEKVQRLEAYGRTAEADVVRLRIAQAVRQHKVEAQSQENELTYMADRYMNRARAALEKAHPGQHFTPQDVYQYAASRPGFNQSDEFKQLMQKHAAGENADDLRGYAQQNWRWKDTGHSNLVLDPHPAAPAAPAPPAETTSAAMGTPPPNPTPSPNPSVTPPPPPSSAPTLSPTRLVGSPTTVPDGFALPGTESLTQTPGATPGTTGGRGTLEVTETSPAASPSAAQPRNTPRPGYSLDPEQAAPTSTTAPIAGFRSVRKPYGTGGNAQGFSSATDPQWDETLQDAFNPYNSGKPAPASAPIAGYRSVVKPTGNYKATSRTL